MKCIIIVPLVLCTCIVIAGRPCGTNDICHDNYDFIAQRRERDDYSVHKDSYYMFIDEKAYHDLVSLHLSYNGGRRPAAPFTPNKGSIDKLSDHEKVTKDILEKSLSTSLGEENDIVYTKRNNYFVVYGVVDLINLEYSIEHPKQAPWFFSAQEIIDHLQEDQLHDIGEVIRYVDQNGLCLENEYKNGVCNVRYYIESFDKVNEWTNQGVYKALYEKPLYVEVGLNPRYFQFYHPGCEHPVHAGNGEGPTYAGVLTGINLPSLENDGLTGEEYIPDGYEYWEMYIRRHGNGYNRVRLNCTFLKLNKTTKKIEWNQPFAGLSSKMYRVVVPKQIPNTHIMIPNTLPISERITNAQLIDIIESEIEASRGSESTVDTSTIEINSDVLDCANVKYNLTSINGISTVILDDPRCIVDTTGSLTYTDPNKVILQGFSETPIPLDYSNLSIKSISFGTNDYQKAIFKIRMEDCNYLTSVIIGDNALSMTQSLSIGNNPNLQLLKIGENACSYNGEDWNQYFAESEFKMFELENLETIVFHDDCMRNAYTVIVNNVMPKNDVFLDGGDAFKGMQEYKPEGDVNEDIDAYFKGITNEPIEELPSEKPEEPSEKPEEPSEKPEEQIRHCRQYVITTAFSSGERDWGFDIFDETNTKLYHWQYSEGKHDDSNPYLFTDEKEFCASYLRAESFGNPKSPQANNVVIKMEIGDGEYEHVMFFAHSTIRPEHGFLTQHYFYLDYPIETKSTWQYYKEQLTTTNWITQQSYKSWSVAPTTAYSESGPFKYFSQTYTVNKSLSNIVSFMLSVRFEYGCVVLMNDIEVQRWNVEGGLNNLVLKEGTTSNPHFNQVTLPLFLLTEKGYHDLIRKGENTVVVILVNGDNESTINFDCSIRLIHNTGLNNRVASRHELTLLPESTISSSYFQYMFSYCSSDHFKPANGNVVYSYVNNKREWINAVSIISSDQSPSNPLPTLKIEGRNSEDESWTTIKYIGGIAFTQSHQKVTYSISNQKAYNTYKLSFTTGKNFEFSEILLFQEKSEKVTTLSYPLRTLYTGCVGSGLVPSEKGYSDFTSDSLPSGCSIDFVTGEIDCSKTVAPFTGTVPITAMRNGMEQTFNIQLKIVDCPYPVTTMYIALSNTGPYPGNAIELFDPDNRMIYSRSFFPKYSNYENFCLVPGIHMIKLYSGIKYGAPQGWNKNDFVHIIADGSFTHYYAQGTKEAEYRTYKFDPTLVTMSSTEWRVYSDKAAVVSNWNDRLFIDSLWDLTTTSEITSEATTIYFRKVFSIPSLVTHHVLNIQVQYIGGIVAYFNGHKVARFNLADDFDADTLALQSSSSAVQSSFAVIISQYEATTTKNVLAFEVHSTSSVRHESMFAATTVFGVNECSLLLYSTPGATLSNSYAGASSYLKLFDTLFNNYYSLHETSKFQEVNKFFTWSVDNLEGASFNAFSIYEAYNRKNCGFSLDVFDDGSYHTVHEHQNMTIPSYPYFSEFLIPYTVENKRHLRLNQQYECESNYLKLNEIYLSYCAAPSCSASGGYPAALNGQLSSISCGDGYIGQKSKQCINGQFGELIDTCVLDTHFEYNSENYMIVRLSNVFSVTPRLNAPSSAITSLTISPALPPELTFNTQTGVISGTLTSSLEETEYTVTALFTTEQEKSVVIHLISVDGDFSAVTKGAEVKDAEGNLMTAEAITSNFYDFYSFDDSSEYTVVKSTGAVVISSTNIIWKYGLPSTKEVIDFYEGFKYFKTNIDFNKKISYTFTSEDIFTHYRTSSNCPANKVYVYVYHSGDEYNKQHYCVTGGATYAITPYPSAIVKDSNHNVLKPQSLVENSYFLYRYYIPDA